MFIYFIVLRILTVYKKVTRSVSKYVGVVKGKTAIRVFSKFPNLKIKPYWGNHFWARRYCADTVGLDLEKIKKYVKYQEKKEVELG